MHDRGCVRRATFSAVDDPRGWLEDALPPPPRGDPASRDEESLARRIPADETEDLRARPELVVRPRSEDEVRALLAAARELRFPVTPQGALTGLSGGALAAGAASRST